MENARAPHEICNTTRRQLGAGLLADLGKLTLVESVIAAAAAAAHDALGRSYSLMDNA